VLFIEKIAELEADVFDAIRQLASEKGLAQITFTDIMQRADIQMSVLLNNYNGVYVYSSIVPCLFLCCIQMYEK